MACTIALERTLQHKAGTPGAARVWKLLLLLPRILLQRTEVTGKAGKLVFEERYQLFAKGDWDTLLNRAKTALNRKQALAGSY